MNAHQLWKITANPINPDKRVRYKQLTARRQKRYVAPPVTNEDLQIPTKRMKQPEHLKLARYSNIGAISNSTSQSVDIDAEVKRSKNVEKFTIKKQFPESYATSHAFDFVNKEDGQVVDATKEALFNVESGQLHTGKRCLLKERKTDTILLRDTKYEQADADNVRFAKGKVVFNQEEIARLGSQTERTVHRSSVTGRRYNIQCVDHQRNHSFLKSHDLFNPEIKPVRPVNRSTFQNIFNMQ